MSKYTDAEWYICASVNYAIIGSDNSLSSVRLQVINWTNAGLYMIGSLWIDFGVGRIKTKYSSHK